MAREYVLYGAPVSYFSRKLEAALGFYGAPFRFEGKSAEVREELETRSGTHQVPVLRTPEGWVIADTTPLLGLLDGRYPRRRMFPEGALGVLVHVVEELLDEWTARVMVHYRWHYDENTRFVVGRFTGREVSVEEAREFPVAQWGRRACRATGTESPGQQKAAEDEYLGVLGALESQLAATPYALGNRPTAVDAVLLGGLRAHILHDPVPDISSYARVVEWSEKRAADWDGGGELAPFPESTPFAHHVLELARLRYRPVVLGNAQAVAEGRKVFVAESYSEEVSYLARPYPEQSRQMIVDRIGNQLTQEERRVVTAWLEEQGLAECFLA